MNETCLVTDSIFQIIEEDSNVCLNICKQDPFCLGYSHIFPIDCILLISNINNDNTMIKISLKTVIRLDEQHSEAKVELISAKNCLLILYGLFKA